jgi:3-oxoacyl-[acyl-carrier protein] reductase
LNMTQQPAETQKPLKGRVALITGGGRGIGRAITLRLAQDGADVAVNFERDEAAAQKVVKEATALGVRAIAIQGSVASFAECQAVVAQVTSSLGDIGILINNAGVHGFGTYLADVTPEEMTHVLGVNLVGAFYMSKAAIPSLRKQSRSDIIFLSSYSVTVSPKGNGPYNISKAAVEQFAFTLAKEERQHGIRINVVSPSLTLTDMMPQEILSSLFGVSDAKELDARSPFGRVGTAEDVASVVGYFVSPANEYVSGQRMVIDGACDAGVIAGTSI